VPGVAGTWKDLTDNVNQLAANLTTQVRAIAEVATAVTKGDLTRSINVAALGEVAALKDNINEMIRNLKDTTLKNSEQDWLKTNLAKFSRMLQGQRDLLTVGRLILSELAPVVAAQQALFYTLDTSTPSPELRLLASYASSNPKEVFRLGEGLIGQCALENQKILVPNVPRDFVRISSGLGQATPSHVIVLPVVFEGQVKAVLELATFEGFNPTHQAFLDQLTESIGIVLNTIEANTRTENLLQQSQSLARELQSQQLELQQTNQQLEEKAGLLAEQNAEVERKNQEVEQARQALEEKAKQLALTSKYKSEFLANMSHELRTPLNSLLILSDQLSRNHEGNLTPKQMEFAKTIHSAGNDLLNLINDILDLSKIESGTVVIDAGEIRFSDLHDYVDRTFRHVAEAKAVDFQIDVDPSVPRGIVTDSKRLQQILKNLLSNAFKFTEKGSVRLEVVRAKGGWSPDQEALNRSRAVIAISVADTGIGIPRDKQQIVFEAFQQADGSTSRKYGGTGLGLAISREIARLLGGEITLESAPGKGSRFTLYLPQSYAPAKPAYKPEPESSAEVVSVMTDVSAARSAVAEAGSVGDIADDRERVGPGDRTLLIVDNDENFARFLLDMAHEFGFKGIVTARGAEAVSLVREKKPDAVTLDIQLPDLDGWRVLDRLKSDPATRHIPVYVITTEEDGGRALPLGAMAVLQKPIKNKETLDRAFRTIQTFLDRGTRRLIAVGSGASRSALGPKLAFDGVETRWTETSREAIAAIEEGAPDCVIFVWDGPESKMKDSADLIRRTCEARGVPLVVYTPGDLGRKVESTLNRLTHGHPVKHVRSEDRLIDQALLFLHRKIVGLPLETRTIVERLARTEEVLAGKKALIVDDDVRNIFALTSVLERHKMNVLAAENGREAIAKLEENEDCDIVLMDIMMPDMDGYDTMRAIRERGKFKDLPIVAVTAKAMKGDREKTIEAGAWDYLSKPVDTEHMLSVLRTWLYR
jgi:signal transduction histidine kinase/DNA-binding response OmpR family regulator/HAMP domain-containing protein